MMAGIGEIAAIAGAAAAVIGAGVSIYSAATADAPDVPKFKAPTSTLPPELPKPPPIVEDKSPERDAQRDAAEERRRLTLRKRLNAPAASTSLTTPSVLGN